MLCQMTDGMFYIESRNLAEAIMVRSPDIEHNGKYDVRCFLLLFFLRLQKALSRSVERMATLKG